MKAKLEAELEEAKKALEKEVEAREHLEDNKRILERENQDLKDRVAEKEHSGSELEKSKKRLQAEIDELSARVDAAEKVCLIFFLKHNNPNVVKR